MNERAEQATQHEDEWYEAGRQAFEWKQPLDLCPDYEKNPTEAHYWSQGWYAAKAEHEQG